MSLPPNYHVATAFFLALDSIRAHKLRSFLTLLGVIIGVASVILVGAAIDGLGVYAEGITAKTFGADSFLVAQIASVGQLTARKRAEKLRYNKRIRPDDLAYLRSATGGEIQYSPYQQRIEDVKGADQVYEGASIIGVSHTLPDIRDVPIADGRFFTETEEQMRRRVAVIGEDIRAALFPAVSPLGQSIRIAGEEFTVIGLLERQGSSFGRSLDNPVYIPATVYWEIYGSQGGMAVFGKARPATNLGLDDALDITRSALRSHFHTQLGKPDNFDTLDARFGALVHRPGSRDHCGDRRARNQYFPRRRRNRHHEHHAGKRDRKNARNRHSAQPGRSQRRHPAAISD